MYKNVENKRMWVEGRNDKHCIYDLICPVCKFRYSPKSDREGCISPVEIYKFCPKCGEPLDDPKPETRW